MMSGIVLTFFSLSLAGQTSNASARAIAKQAYETIRAHPFEGSFLQAAASDIKRAGALDPKESYVFLATAALVETTGYKSGDRSRAASFDPKALALAEKLLKHAIDRERIRRRPGRLLRAAPDVQLIEQDHRATARREPRQRQILVWPRKDAMPIRVAQRLHVEVTADRDDVAA